MSYEELTGQGRARRLRALAMQVVDRGYALRVGRLQAIGMHSFNSVFRLDTARGRYALRIGEPVRIHASGVEDVEAWWLSELRTSDITTAQVVPDRHGEWWRTETHPTVPGSRVCTLFHWVDGAPLLDRIDSRGLRESGRLLARLHEHAAGLDLPTTGRPIRANRAVYLGQQDVIDTYESPHRSLFVEARARIQELVDELWKNPPHPPHLLHGDFGPHNLLRYRGELRPIDFQDLQVGFAAQDLAISCTDLSRSAPGYVEPFRTGYQEIRPLPDSSPETQAALAAARSLNIMNLALLAPRTGIGRGLVRHAAVVTDWMNAAKSSS